MYLMLENSLKKMETRLRDTINTIYFGRTKDIVSFLRKKMGSIMRDQQRLQDELNRTLQQKKNKNQ